jgi:ketosteroid isomerase-like protein
MGSANVELVRSLFADWERGDFTPAEWAHPEIEFVIADGPEPGTSTGLAGMAQAMRGWLSGWENYRLEAEQYRELDDERVLVFYSQSGRGKASGLELAQRWPKAASLFLIRDNKVTSLVTYFDRERALADLGLGPEGDAASRDSANLDLVHSIYQRRDFGSADSNDDPAFFDRMWRDYLDEEFEYRGTGGYPEGELVFSGREGLAQLLAMLRDAWAEFRFEPERLSARATKLWCSCASRARAERAGCRLSCQSHTSGLSEAVA